MLLCTIPLAAVASCVVYLGARYEDRGRCGFRGLLLIMGVQGPGRIQWLMDTLTNVFTKVLPGNKPAGGGGSSMAEHVDHKITLFSKGRGRIPGRVVRIIGLSRDHGAEPKARTLQHVEAVEI